MRTNFLALFLALAATMQAYVTSAQLEYSVDDFAEIYLNGHEVLGKSGQHWADFAVLSTSDGSLPLKYFELNGENVLAIRDMNVTGMMSMSYRLTVHHSSGDPVVIWGDTNDTRYLHLKRDQTIPQGWYLRNFDDSSWKQPVEEAPQGQFMLPEPLLQSFFGSGVIPRLGNRSDGQGGNGDNDLYRSRFSFPYTPGRTNILINPQTAKKGETVALRLMIGGDTSDIGPFNLYADLPLGLDPFQLPQGATYDLASRRLKFGQTSEPGLRYLRLPLASVVSASGWNNPQAAIYGDGPVESKFSNPIPDPNYWQRAIFTPGAAGRFAFASPPPAFTAAAPKILGVIFHSRVYSSGLNHGNNREVDKFFFNYSTDAAKGNNLKNDVLVGRTGAADAYDAYYDATEDRAWTWADFNHLEATYVSQAVGKPDKGGFSGAWVVVKCFSPNLASPVFYAKVSSPRCENLDIKAGILAASIKAPVSDDLELPVNSQGCPSPTPTPVPVVVAKAATPEPAKPVAVAEDLGLACLKSSPEPFKSGGVFVEFCLKKPANIALEVYASSGGSLLRRMEAGSFRAGEGKMFYNGMSDEGKPLKPGDYVYQVIATSPSGAKIVRYSAFKKVADKR